MLVRVKKMTKKGEKWKTLEYHRGLTFLLHLHMTRVMNFLNYQEALRLRLQSECVRHAITFIRAPHIPSEESRKQSEVSVRRVNEWSEQKSTPWFYKIQKTLPSTVKQELATTLIDLFQRSMSEDGSASHPESEVWRDSFEITLMHTRFHEP